MNPLWPLLHGCLDTFDQEYNVYLMERTTRGSDHRRRRKRNTKKIRLGDDCGSDGYLVSSGPVRRTHAHYATIGHRKRNGTTAVARPIRDQSSPATTRADPPTIAPTTATPPRSRFGYRAINTATVSATTFGI